MLVGEGMAAHTVPQANPVTDMVPRHSRQRILGAIRAAPVNVVNNKIVKSLDAKLLQNGQSIRVRGQVGIVEGHRHRGPREPLPSAEFQAVVEVREPETHLAKSGQLGAEGAREAVRNGVIAENPPVRLGPCGWKSAC